MFYSQFILAKKGPLGTIWIAAHLERKLRKNQVADTDIGVSVDSILCPDVPIALRLSSHLLLGVVRIYSRKVNYLFDDCSEALLKIKQAFRSTAVDLPPEESTAPYNSITLPETFDLDDFELPENDTFQGNFVDHHISSRDQITLQDTMDGIVYSTSQFGPDERFGDGDASGLDLLDEEMLLDKMAAGEADLTLGSDGNIHASVEPMTPGDTNQMEGGGDDDDDDTEFAAYAQAPCTPGLMEEPNLSIVQETSACDDHMETDNHQKTPEFLVKENLENAYSKSELLQPEKQNVVDWPLVDEHNSPNKVPPVPAEKNGYCLDDLESHQIKQPLNLINLDDNMLARDNVDVACNHLKQQQQQLGKSALTMDHQNKGNVLVDGTTTSIECSVEGIMGQPIFEVSSLENNQEQFLATKQVSNDVETDGTQKDKPSDESNRKSDDTLGKEKLEYQFSQQSKDSGIVKEYTGPQLLSPCTTTLLNQSTPLNPGNDDRHLPFEEPSGLCSRVSYARDEIVHAPIGDVAATEISKQFLEEIQHIRPDLIQRDGFQSGNIDNSIRSDFSAPEKLLSVPEGSVFYGQNDSLAEATPYKEAMMSFDRSGAVSETVSGRKRSYAESSLTVQSLYSVESSGFLHSKGTVESFPADNDLLSSILVGRKSTVLKVKPTTETKPMKRSRSTTRPSSYKRKVLMDDSMVLHGDTIREQLTNTADIRRMRKKAPCTSTEISMIQRQFLEDEIFAEPILTGVSLELMSLHNQTYDLSDIRVTQSEVKDASSKFAADPQSVSLGQGVAVEEVNHTDMFFQRDVTKDHGISRISEFIMVRDEAPQVQFADTLIHAENSTQVQADSTSKVPEVDRSSPHVSCLGESAQVENNGNCISDVTAVNPDTDAIDRNVEADDTSLRIEIEASNILKSTDANEAAEKTDNDDIAAVEKILDNEAACENDEATADHAKIVVGENGDGIAVVVETESREKDELEGTEGGFPRASCSPKMLTTNLAILDEEIRKHSQEQTANEYMIFDEQVNEYNAKDSVLNGIWCEQDSLYPAEGANMMDLRNAYLDNDGENCGHPPFVIEAELSATEIKDDFDYSAAGHDTGFLNFDDDDEVEVDGDDLMPSTEETQIFENTGWSSRTRAVANYLQTLFEKEAERGRKVLPMDNLLSGKTRKEASRMFFETLVLKTKDYVHVEQNAPFDNINIYPHSKLLKTDF